MTANRPGIIKRESLSYSAYRARAGETRHVEWSRGQVLFYPLPDTAHQLLATFLTSLLTSFVAYFKLGQVIAAPFETRLWSDGPAREPDVLFVSRDQQAQLDEQRFSGGPALVVEIVSPASAAEDRGRKFQEYEQADVQEYWIIDPRPDREQADFYQLDDAGRFRAAALDADGVFHSRVLDGFWLRWGWLTETPLPNPQQALAEIMRRHPALSAKSHSLFAALFAHLHHGRRTR